MPCCLHAHMCQHVCAASVVSSASQKPMSCALVIMHSCGHWSQGRAGHGHADRCACAARGQGSCKVDAGQRWGGCQGAGTCATVQLQRRWDVCARSWLHACMAPCAPKVTGAVLGPGGPSSSHHWWPLSSCITPRPASLCTPAHEASRATRRTPSTSTNRKLAPTSHSSPECRTPSPGHIASP